MKLSHYLKVYPFEERPGHLLLYSTKRSSKVLLTKDAFDSISNGTLSPDNEAALSRLGMIVPDIGLEKQEALGMLDEINDKNQKIRISVILNLDCNFNCVYCYEGDMKGKFYMTNETAGLLIDFIKDRFTDRKKTIHIDFYGGEPLLSVNLIRYICSELRTFARDNGVRYTFTLVTNGSLFTRRIAEELAQLGLTGIKTTLDGPPELHNTTRPFKTGAGSFDTIVRNIAETCGIVKITVGGNYNMANFEKFPLLFDHLEKNGLAPGKIHELTFYPVMKNPADINASVDFADGLMSVNEPWVVRAGSYLREEILKRGYRSSKIMPSLCQTEIRDAFVVNYDGAVYKCPAFIGREQFSIGTLKDGLKDYSSSLNIGMYKIDECKECVYLPLCFGGCRYMSFVRDGNIDRVDCQKPYFDSELETLIKQDVKYTLS